MGKLYIASNGSGVHSSEVTAKSADVLAGTKTIMADSNDEVVEGGMIDHGAISKALKCGESITIPQGYHNGSGEISADSLASQTEGTATASDLYTGKTMVVNGQKITGTMKDLSKNTSIQYASDNSAKVIAGDAVFKAKNTDNVDRVCIRYNGSAGFITSNTLFGIPSTSFGTVLASNVRSGQTFTSTAGIKVTGTMSVQSAISFSAAATSYNTIRISWKNPAKGPWQGVFIQMSTSGNPGTGGGSRVYTGRGNSSSANASNYVDITGLNANTTYYFTCTSYVDNLGWGTSYNVNAKTTLPSGKSILDGLGISVGGGYGYNKRTGSVYFLSGGSWNGNRYRCGGEEPGEDGTAYWRVSGTLAGSHGIGLSLSNNCYSDVAAKLVSQLKVKIGSSANVGSITRTWGGAITSENSKGTRTFSDFRTYRSGYNHGQPVYDLLIEFKEEFDSGTSFYIDL